MIGARDIGHKDQTDVSFWSVAKRTSKYPKLAPINQLSDQIHENPYSDKLEHHFVNATQDDVRWDPLMDPSSIQNEQDGGSLASRNQNRLLLLKINDQKIVTITYDPQNNTSNSVLINFIFIDQELLKIHDQ